MIKLKLGQAIFFYWHGEVMTGHIDKIDGKSITIRDAEKSEIEYN